MINSRPLPLSSLSCDIDDGELTPNHHFVYGEFNRWSYVKTNNIILYQVDMLTMVKTLQLTVITVLDNTVPKRFVMKFIFS